MLERLECGCEIDIEPSKRIIWCPRCGRYQLDVFLGEPFPSGFYSPFRQLLKGIFSQNLPLNVRIAGKFLELQGTETWPMIAGAIKNSDICFFDMTGEIFNVGFELGYALSQWNYTGFKKYILVGSSEDPSDHVLRNMNIMSVLPQERDLTQIIQHYFSEGDFRAARGNRESVDIIKKFQKDIATRLFDLDIEAEIESLYGAIDYPSKRKERDVLVLTTEDNKRFFEVDERSRLTSMEFMLPDSLDSLFLNVSRMRVLLQRIFQDIIKKYDYIIVDLQGKEFEDAKKFNFECALIAGMMRGFKGEREQVDFYITHEENGRPFLRCSDVGRIPRYAKSEDIEDIVKKILRNNIIS